MIYMYMYVCIYHTNIYMYNTYRYTFIKECVRACACVRVRVRTVHNKLQHTSTKILPPLDRV